LSGNSHGSAQFHAPKAIESRWGHHFDFAELVVTRGAPGDAATVCGEVQRKRHTRMLSQRCAKVAVVTAPPAKISAVKREIVVA